MTGSLRGLPPLGAAVLCVLVSMTGRIHPVSAAPLVACHCFRDRDYDPAQPGKTDVYLLATTTNTFLAAAFGFPKAEVVRGRMSGVSGDDFWIAAYAAHHLGVPREDLLGRRTRSGSWKGVFLALRMPLEPLGPSFIATLAAGDDTALARTAAAETMAERLGAPRQELAALAAGGASVQETVLAVFLGRWSREPARAIYERVKSGAATWSGVLAGLGGAPVRMEQMIPRELTPAGGRP